MDKSHILLLVFSIILMLSLVSITEAGDKGSTIILSGGGGYYPMMFPMMYPMMYGGGGFHKGFHAGIGADFGGGMGGYGYGR